MGKRAKQRRARAKRKLGFLPSVIEQNSGRERGIEGVGWGPHQETSPLARATVTPNRRERQRRKDRQLKQKGWQ